MRVLLDTDVLIDVEKGVRELPETENYISVIMLYEFIRGRRDFEKQRSFWKKPSPYSFDE